MALLTTGNTYYQTLVVKEHINGAPSGVEQIFSLLEAFTLGEAVFPSLSADAFRRLPLENYNIRKDAFLLFVEQEVKGFKSSSDLVSPGPSTCPILEPITEETNGQQ